MTREEHAQIFADRLNMLKNYHDLTYRDICKNCSKCRPTYKGGICEKTGKKTKLTATCEDWRPKK